MGDPAMVREQNFRYIIKLATLSFSARLFVSDCCAGACHIVLQSKVAAAPTYLMLPFGIGIFPVAGVMAESQR